MTRIVALVVLVFLFNTALPANQVWKVPDSNARKVNPVLMEAKNANIGKGIFIRSCASCHGSRADGRGLITSANLVSDSIQKQSDGAIFYKVSTGRNKMPPFASMLKEQEIWSVVNFLRVLKNPKLLPPPQKIKLEVIVNPNIQSVTAFVCTKDTLHIPISDVDIHFYIQRDFGNMEFGDKYNFTKTNGKVTVGFPDNIIGDSVGNVKIYVKVENNFMYMDTSVVFIQKWGKPLESHTELSQVRALWSARDKSPIWLLFLANGIIVAVWGAIIYVVIIIIRIKKAGRIFIR